MFAVTHLIGFGGSAVQGGPVFWDEENKSANVSIDATGKIMTIPSSASQAGARVTRGISSGEYYWEVENTDWGANTSTQAGICNASWTFSNSMGSDANAWCLNFQNGNKIYNGSSASLLSQVAQGEVAMLALNMSSGKLWFGREGTWSGDPAAGTGEAFSGITGTVYAAAKCFNVGDDLTLRSKEGDFSYSVPSGYLALDRIPRY